MSEIYYEKLALKSESKDLTHFHPGPTQTNLDEVGRGVRGLRMWRLPGGLKLVFGHPPQIISLSQGKLSGNRSKMKLRF